MNILFYVNLSNKKIDYYIVTEYNIQDTTYNMKDKNICKKRCLTVIKTKEKRKNSNTSRYTGFHNKK